jgi:alpha-tubulin suppressor-like RCC1 family protein
MVNPFLRKTAFLLSALTFGVAGCNTQPATPQQQEQEDSATATFSIKAADLYNTSGASQNRSLSALSLTSAQAFSFADVSSIRIDVLDKDANTPLYLNFDLLPLPPDGWVGKLPFLPKNKALHFSARALNDAGEVLFKGSTDQTLVESEQTIVITLAAGNDGQTINIPRIRRITVPSAFNASQSGNVSFSVEGNNGDTINYEIISEAESGTFFPTSGSIKLEAISGTFVSQYAPPTVSAETDYTHTVKVTNKAGHSVTTTFKTKVKPPGSNNGVKDTIVEVLFNPVINSIASSRVPNSDKVFFEASVTDNEDVSSLQYAWSFTSAEGTSFSAVFAENVKASNPTTLSNYTPAVRGTIKLVVTDSDGGSTTLNYPMAANQFPDNPVVEGGLTGINTIRAGESHTCVLFNNGGMRCFGLNDNGQLGYGNTFDVGDDEKPSDRQDLALLGLASRISVGGHHTCAVLDTGLMRCWGKNTYGQLGYNTKLSVGDGEAIASYGYVNVGGPVRKVAAGYEHTCALLEDGNVRCWGRNNFGQLGLANTTDIGDDEQPYRASLVELDGTAKDIVAGGYHTCALMTSGSVRCWGYNAYGQLGLGNAYSGNNSIGDSEVPASVPPVAVGGNNVLQLSAGLHHTCALLDTGNMRCWGHNGSGRLGYGSSPGELHAPTEDVDVGGQVLQIAAGESHTCALLSTGAVKCWGNGANGRLGYGKTDPKYTPDDASVYLDDATAFQITAGGDHTCALLSTGAARCWGLNTSGQLGRGDKTTIGDTESPTREGDIEFIKP